MWIVSMLEKAVSIILTSVGLNTRPYFSVVAVLHLDVGLGEEAEDLRQQVALVVGRASAPSPCNPRPAALPRASSGPAAGASRIRRPRDIRTACTACGLRGGTWVTLLWESEYGNGVEARGSCSVHAASRRWTRGGRRRRTRRCRGNSRSRTSRRCWARRRSRCSARTATPSQATGKIEAVPQAARGSRARRERPRPMPARRAARPCRAGREGCAARSLREVIGADRRPCRHRRRVEAHIACKPTRAWISGADGRHAGTGEQASPALISLELASGHRARRSGGTADADVARDDR